MNKIMNKITLTLNASLLSFSIFLFGCGDTNQTTNKANTNVANSNATVKTNGNTNPASSNVSTPNSDKSEIPVGKPIESGNTQTVKNISITTPKDWKKIKSPEEVTKYASSDNESEAISVAIMSKENETLKGSPKQPTTIDEYFAQVKEMGQPVRLLEIDGKKGILTVQPESITWTTFPPSDKSGKTAESTIMITYPQSKYEQNKQLISDILYSVKIK